MWEHSFISETVSFKNIQLESIFNTWRNRYNHPNCMEKNSVKQSHTAYFLEEFKTYTITLLAAIVGVVTIYLFNKDNSVFELIL